MNRLDNAGWDPCMQIWNIFVWRLRSLKAMFGITEIMAVGFSWTLWQVFAESTVQRLDVPPMLLLDKKGTRTAELVQPAKEESTRWDESFPLFPAIFSAPNTAAELCFTYWRISAVFWKAGLWVSLVMCTRLFAFVICASITLALKGKRTCYVHLDRGFSSPPWHWHWKASAPSNPTCRQHRFQRFSSSEILLHSPC